MSPRCFIHSYDLQCALGRGRQEVWDSIQKRVSPFRLNHPLFPHHALFSVDDPLPELPDELKDFSCRNNQLLLSVFKGIEDSVRLCISKYGSHRVAVILGSSTSGVHSTEEAFLIRKKTGELPKDYLYLQQEMGAPSKFIAKLCGITGPAYTISAACASSAKSFRSARDLIASGLVDAVITGGADTLCRMTLFGFESLESYSNELCQPMSLNRRGINIGEGAALFLLSREESELELLGVGESQDAYHISSPDPEGKGAELSMRLALKQAKLKAEEVSYLNLHGTATPLNDRMESHAVARVFSDGVLCSSTKPFTGHTLGAAGAIEAAICCMLIDSPAKGWSPPQHLWDGVRDPDLARLHLNESKIHGTPKRKVCASNSFAFGGTNCTVIFGES